MSRPRKEKEDAAARIDAEIERRRLRGEPFEQVQVGRKRGALCGEFWGEAWCGNLEAYSDYEDRLPRGKSYLRAGNVYDLTIEPGEIFAYVTGAEIYDVLIKIEPVSVAAMERVKAGCIGKVGSVLDLLSGSLGPSVMAALTDLDSGLIPRPGEIWFECSCPDWAGMCKHIAAVLYAVGVELDERPELLFVLRQADLNDLVSAAADGAGAIADFAPPHENRGADLSPDGLSELFGIEISEPESAF